MEKWVVTAKRADFTKIAQEFHIDPVIARIIRNRDVETFEQIHEYLHGTINDIPSPWSMKDMKKAVQLINEKIKNRNKIRIIGDYDIDGVTSTHILVTGLRMLGADVDTYIPDRIKDGYGMHEQLVVKAYEDGIDTIVTCDNGIAASNEIALAKGYGMTVIVTDHHEIPYEDIEGERIFHIPEADAVINPKQEDCQYPNKNICGAVVAWKLVWALLEDNGHSRDDIFYFLEFAAIATVGDVMDLQGENRIIVKEGLRRLPNTKNPGLQALMQANGLDGGEISAYHVGFVLGPCINASGRLDTALRSLSLLGAKNQTEAAKIAGDLTALNQSRKSLTEIGRDEAERMIEETEIGKDRVLVVYMPDCHESLAGIIAGRIREKYNKPAFVLTKSEDGVKGSGRSIESYSMYEELVKCGDLLEKFGGHPMAAGLSLKEENVDIFRKRLNQLCTLTAEDLCPKVVIDVPMPISYLSWELVHQLTLLEPFGKANTKPLFAQKGLHVMNPRILGKNQNVVKMQLVDETGNTRDGVYFGEAQKFVDFLRGKDSIMITYYPDINYYQGRETLQIVIKNYC